MVAPVLALAGFMGSGKTSVGRALAESHGYEFVDLDDVVVADAGMSVERMFAERGEREFRQLELAALRRDSPQRPHLEHTGAGSGRRHTFNGRGTRTPGLWMYHCLAVC